MVGEGRPAKLAEGAAMGIPDDLINSKAILFFGILIATVSALAVTSSGTIFFLKRTRVKGPGQNSLAKILASLGMFLANKFKSSILAM